MPPRCMVSSRWRPAISAVAARTASARLRRLIVEEFEREVQSRFVHPPELRGTLAQRPRRRDDVAADVERQINRQKQAHSPRPRAFVRAIRASSLSAPDRNPRGSISTRS